MKKIQRMQYGATRPIHYSLELLAASLILVLAGVHSVGCDSGENESARRSLPSNAVAAAQEVARDTRRDDSNGGDDPRMEQPVVVFLGTSLTAGYGLEEAQAFPALIQSRIDAAGLSYRVINAGVSGDTSAGGLRRLDWLLRLPVAILVVELGANDMLRGLGIEQLEQNLDAIIERTRRAHPGARFLIAGMRAAPNLGSDYRREFDGIYPALAQRHDARLVPFLLEDVAARRNLNQADGIHPTAEGHQLIAERVWEALDPILRSN